MNWFLLLVIGAAVLIVARLFFKLRALRNLRQDDWDAKTIDRLRKQGSDPFQPHEVDFFFGLTSEDACRAVNAQLETEGCVVDVKAVPENTDFPFSMHARRSMRLSVPDMQETSRRYAALAAAHGGRYDGWAADVVK